MPIKKTKTLKSGVSGDYWDIHEIKLSVSRNEGYATMVLYLNEEIRKQPESIYITDATRIVRFDLSEDELKKITDLIFSKVKKDKYFEDAVDVID